MISEQDLQVIAKYVIDAFQKGKFKAILPPIRAEINTLKCVGLGHSLVDGKEGEALTLYGLIPGKFISIQKVGRDLEISLSGLPKIDSVHIENLKGVSIRNPKNGDILVFVDGAWRQFSLENFDIIRELRLLKTYPDEDKEKLRGIESGAQKNPSAEAIKALYESNQNTNPFTNQDKSVLADVAVRAHSHKNKETIDSYTVKNEDIQKAVEASHVHPNMELLTKIVSTGSGKIITDEERVGLAELIGMLPELRKFVSKSY